MIPGNDDAMKSIRLFTTAIADAVIEGGAMSRGGLGEAVVSGGELDDVEVIRRGADDGAGEE